MSYSCPFSLKGMRKEPTEVRNLNEIEKVGDIAGALECVGGSDGLCDRHPEYYVHEKGMVHPYLVCAEHKDYREGVKAGGSVALITRLAESMGRDTIVVSTEALVNLRERMKAVGQGDIWEHFIREYEGHKHNVEAMQRRIGEEEEEEKPDA